jgi:DNA-binding FadR family transcriptional regulator
MPTGISRYRQRGAARDRIAEVLMAATAPLTTPALAERCRLSRALVAAELAALERAGWAERQQGTGAKQPDAWSWRHELGGAVA